MASGKSKVKHPENPNLCWEIGKPVYSNTPAPPPRPRLITKTCSDKVKVVLIPSAISCTGNEGDWRVAFQSQMANVSASFPSQLLRVTDSVLTFTLIYFQVDGHRVCESIS